MNQYEVKVELKKKLRSKGLTSRECANALGVSPSTVNNMLNGFIPLPMDKEVILETLVGDDKSAI